jgi:hypothetical protein
VPQLGFTLHGIEQYEEADRDEVAASFALGRYVGVMAVVPFSPADKAGLTADDQLVSVNELALLPLASDAGTAADARVVMHQFAERIEIVDVGETVGELLHGKTATSFRGMIHASRGGCLRSRTAADSFASLPEYSPAFWPSTALLQARLLSYY